MRQHARPRSKLFLDKPRQRRLQRMQPTGKPSKVILIAMAPKDHRHRKCHALTSDTLQNKLSGQRHTTVIQGA